MAGRPSHYLEDGGVHFLVVILFASVFPRDPEHALLVVLPDQPWVHGTVDLLDQPLPQPPAAVAVTHPWKEKTWPVKSHSRLMTHSTPGTQQPSTANRKIRGSQHRCQLGGNPRIQELWATCCEKTMPASRASNPEWKLKAHWEVCSCASHMWPPLRLWLCSFQLSPPVLFHANTAASESITHRSSFSRRWGKSLSPFQVPSMSSPSL